VKTAESRRRLESTHSGPTVFDTPIGRGWIRSARRWGVQQKLMRHADIRTTMNVYGDAATDEITEAHSKVVGLALNGAQAERNATRLTD